MKKEIFILLFTLLFFSCRKEKVVLKNDQKVLIELAGDKRVYAYVLINKTCDGFSLLYNTEKQHILLNNVNGIFKTNYTDRELGKETSIVDVDGDFLPDYKTVLGKAKKLKIVVEP